MLCCDLCGAVVWCVALWVQLGGWRGEGKGMRGELGEGLGEWGVSGWVRSEIMHHRVGTGLALIKAQNSRKFLIFPLELTLKFS